MRRPNAFLAARIAARRHLAHALLGAVAGGVPVHAAPAHPFGSPALSFNGFGTLGAVRSDQAHADVVSSVYLQPNGAGHTSTWHLGVDSKIGGQLDVRFDSALSGVVQVISKHRYDNSWTPEIEWANLKYELTPGLSVRAGRTVTPFFMLSDTANVGYANPWIRGPQELYGTIPVTHLDGVDVAWNTAGGRITNAFQVSFGQNTFDAVGGVEISGKDAWMVSDTVELGDLALRAGYLAVDLTFESDDLDALTGALSGLGRTLDTAGFPGAGRRAAALAGRYRMDDTPFEMYTVGGRFEHGNWLLLAEWARLSDAGVLPRTHAWYATAGYQMHRVRPYLTFADLESAAPSPTAIPAAGLPPPLQDAAGALNAGLGAALRGAAPSQRSWTVGLRWDFVDSAALKVEYQHIRLEDHSAGRLGNLQPGFRPQGNADLVSVALDFVF